MNRWLLGCDVDVGMAQMVETILRVAFVLESKVFDIEEGSRVLFSNYQ